MNGRVNELVVTRGKGKLEFDFNKVGRERFGIVTTNGINICLKYDL